MIKQRQVFSPFVYGVSSLGITFFFIFRPNQPKATPRWFYESIEAAIENGEDLSYYRNITINHIRDVVEHFSCSRSCSNNCNQNYKIFNEVLHGDFWRANFPGIWEEAIATARAADPNVELFVNDFQVISGDTSQCFADLVKDYDFDAMGMM